jgi:hypothetical protein
VQCHTLTLTVTVFGIQRDNSCLLLKILVVNYAIPNLRASVKAVQCFLLESDVYYVGL